ncbi:MAG: family 16 glycosylhydrolase [candidate division KSB1 bacterium]|nr:family 16 glycosylhydrolase [candidate division KSB1 bacterium]
MRIDRKIFLFTALLCPVIVVAKNYKGAELRTKVAYTYGRFEVRLKSAQREGVVSSFFTYYDGDVSLNWNEIDIEILGRYADDVQFNTITPGQNNHVRHQPIPFNPHVDFHTYAFEWTPEYVAWFIDGFEAYRQTGEHIAMLNKSQKIMMNIWNPAFVNWVGSWGAEALPAFSYYDWVSYASYTPGTGNTGTNNNFTQQWRDDFDSWDQARWAKATHTFNGNNCDFVPENVVFQNGLMTLCLTDTTNLGYVDRNPPVVKWARASGNNVTVMFSEEIDKITAERPSNYLIPNVTISGVQLLQDQKSVLLETSGLNATISPTLVVMGVRDRAANPNVIAVRGVSVIQEAPPTFPLQINVGGAQQGDFLADQPWSERAAYGFLDGSAKQWPSILPIANTEQDTIYLTERWGLVFYKVRVPNGNYRVTLMMVENNFAAAGKRVFDIFIEGKLAVDNIDLFHEVGANTAYVKIIDPVEVTDEILDLHFAAVIDQPLLNGLIIETSTAAGVRELNAGPKQFCLAQNFPNPFNAATTIRYDLAATERLQFQVFDLLGNVVYQKDLGMQPAGKNEFRWEAVDALGQPLSSGIYFYKLVGKQRSPARKLLLLK